MHNYYVCPCIQVSHDDYTNVSLKHFRKYMATHHVFSFVQLPQSSYSRSTKCMPVIELARLINNNTYLDSDYIAILLLAMPLYYGYRLHDFKFIAKRLSIALMAYRGIYRCRSDMGTPAKWAPPDPKSLVKQSSQRPHFASDLRTLQRYGDVNYAHCAAAYSQGGGASFAQLQAKNRP